MNLGVFSLSLNVSDIEVSKQFYENLGFEVFGGVLEQKWLIMKQGDTIIGLFEGQLDSNIMTFNPGWDSNCGEVNPFTDVRDIQKELKDKGVEFVKEAETSTTGPEHFIILDPDGNTILVDQHR